MGLSLWEIEKFMNVLQLSAHFSPNVGGVETHLDDLVAGLVKRKYQISVLTYQPLSIDVSAPFYEKNSRLEIIRVPWIKGLFYKLVNQPALEFIYLFPGLFGVLPILLLRKKYHLIHAHGLVAATVAIFWKFFFRIRVVVSTHSLYHFPKKGIYRSFVKLILNQADGCLCLSKKSNDELITLGIPKQKLSQFTYWIDTNLYKPASKIKLRKKFNLNNEFIMLFVGRLVEEKGIKILINAYKNIKGNQLLIIAGDGPLKNYIMKVVQQNKRIRFVGRLGGQELANYYALSDLLIVPSIHDEGFGRVILEALAAGTPVLGSNRGSIPEAIDTSVGRLFKVSSSNIRKEIAYLKNHPDVLKKLSLNSRRFAEKRFSEKNIEKIILTYDK
jgi:glycosyltransferase involved in cell wall biosynthesis